MPGCCHGNVVQTSFKFKKMFPDLKKLDVTNEQNLQLSELMKKTLTKSDISKIPAIFTFFGQFVDHDITKTNTEGFSGEITDINSRTPYLELDSVYGKGPILQPELYDDFGVKLLWNENNSDLIRDKDDVAIIGDPRNDENLIIAQIQLLFIKFHNKVVDCLKEKNNEKCKYSNKKLFKKAQKIVRTYYQSIVVNDFLKRIVHKCIIEDIIKNGNHHYEPTDEMWFPYEFTIAAYRYGHATVLDKYRINDDELMAMEDIFTHRKKMNLQWKHFIDLECKTKPLYCKKITPFLIDALYSIPGDAPEPLIQNSLPSRNLFRAKQCNLTSGQECAKYMKEKIVDLSKYTFLNDINLMNETPLWYYILAEADVNENGERLGSLGGRLVAEVILRSIKSSPDSYLSKKKCCFNKLGCCKKFTLKKLIKFVEKN